MKAITEPVQWESVRQSMQHVEVLSWSV